MPVGVTGSLSLSELFSVSVALSRCLLALGSLCCVGVLAWFRLVGLAGWGWGVLVAGVVFSLAAGTQIFPGGIPPKKDLRGKI